MSITRAQIVRQMYADGGRGYSDYASPSSSTASRDFETQGVSGGQVSYGGSDDDRYIPKVTYPDQVQRTLQDNSLIGKIGNTLKTVGNYAGQRPTTVLGLASGFNPYLLGISYLANKFGPPRSTGYLENVSPSISTANLTPGQRVSGGTYNGPPMGGGDNQVLIPPVLAQTPTDIDSTLSDFDIYMQNLTANAPNRFSLSSRFAAAEGGTPRQAYGLGSIVKKITKPIEKILKSDVGKALALYTAGTYLGGTQAFGGSGGSAWERFKNIDNLKNLANPFSSEKPGTFKIADFLGLGGDKTVGDKVVKEGTKKTLPGIVKYGIPVAMAATYFGTDEEEANLDDITDRTDESGLKELMAKYPALRFQVPRQYQLAAKGGRIGYEDAGMVNPDELSMSKEGSPMFTDTETGEEVGYPYNEEMSSAPNIDAELYQMYLDAIGSGQIPKATTFDQYKELMSNRMGAKEGGLMDLGGMEKDYRAEGGFVPIGKAEKADDVPARLSKNEFVFTADAVRNAGGGDIDKGAEVMYNVMKNLESGGKMSDESQGLKGARDMFQTSQRLGEIL
jgi:hypothetical protein